MTTSLSTRDQYIIFLKHKYKFDKVMQQIEKCHKKTFAGFIKPSPRFNEDLWDDKFEDGLLAIYWYCRSYNKRENGFILHNSIPYMKPVANIY